MLSFEAETGRCPSTWNVRTRTFESCAWESVGHEEICEAGTESTAVLADVTCDAAEVEVIGVEDDAGVGVPAVGKERPQWEIAPPKPPETRIGCTGYALPHRIPARARAATLAPRMRWYRAHRLHLDVCARTASTREPAACHGLASIWFWAMWVTSCRRRRAPGRHVGRDGGEGVLNNLRAKSRALPVVLKRDVGIRPDNHEREMTHLPAIAKAA